MLWLILFAMRAMMPRTDRLPGIEDTDVRGFLRRMRAAAAPRYWLGLAAGAIVFMATPLLTVRLPLPACLLSRRRLEEHAARLASHPIYLLRQSILLVRLSAGMCWGSDAGVRARFALAPYGPDPGTFRTS